MSDSVQLRMDRMPAQLVGGWELGLLVLMAILFLRVAYVSLPRGIPPFDRIADLFLLIPGV